MSLEPIFSSKRSFQVWHYTVSHNQLLLRSNKNSSSSLRLEILFKNVGFISISTSINGIVITEWDAAESGLPALITASKAFRTCYRVEANGAIGFIVAAIVVTAEDALDYWEPSSLLVGGLRHNVVAVSLTA